MSTVTQCDVCGNVTKHEQSFYLRLNKVTKDDKIGQEVICKDICADCKIKMFKALGMEDE